MKKLLSILLSLTMVFAMTATAFAAKPSTQFIENNIEYITIYDEDNNTVQAVQRNVITNEYVYGPVIAVETETNTAQTPELSALGADVHQDTFLNFEYDIWYNTPYGNEWNLERPTSIFSQGYFMVYQNSSNYDNLREWKSDIDTLNAAEWAAIPLIGMAGFSIVTAAIESHAAIATGGILTPVAIASIKSAGKWTASAAVAVGLVCSSYNDSAISYTNVLYNTDNIHH